MAMMMMIMLLLLLMMIMMMLTHQTWSTETRVAEHVRVCFLHDCSDQQHTRPHHSPPPIMFSFLIISSSSSLIPVGSLCTTSWNRPGLQSRINSASWEAVLSAFLGLGFVFRRSSSSSVSEAASAAATPLPSYLRSLRRVCIGDHTCGGGRLGGTGLSPIDKTAFLKEKMMVMAPM